jgi:hypothetical protein
VLVVICWVARTQLQSTVNLLKGGSVVSKSEEQIGFEPVSLGFVCGTLDCAFEVLNGSLRLRE